MTQTARAVRSCLSVTLSAWAGAALAAPNFDIAPYPLFLSPSVKPNLMIIFDNSQSMDATMGGKVISGDDTTTRANIARSVLRTVIDANQFSINWGLTTFATTADILTNTQAYYLGRPNVDLPGLPRINVPGLLNTMTYTNDCVDNGVPAIINGVSATNGGLRCIANPDSRGRSTRLLCIKCLPTSGPLPREQCWRE